MFSYSGLWYRIITVPGLLLVFGILFFLIKKPWKNRKWLIGGATIVVVFVLFGLYYGRALLYPAINHLTGEYYTMHISRARVGIIPLNYEYVFFDEDGQKVSFYLDYFSKQKIYPKQLMTETKYTIYYEEGTKVIMRLELQ